MTDPTGTVPEPQWNADRNVERFAEAFFYASRQRLNLIPPRWAFVDPVIRGAFLDAVRLYFDGYLLEEPRLKLRPRRKNGVRLNDEWVVLR